MLTSSKISLGSLLAVEIEHTRKESWLGVLETAGFHDHRGQRFFGGFENLLEFAELVISEGNRGATQVGWYAGRVNSFQ